jgi:hypothetical protein
MRSDSHYHHPRDTRTGIRENPCLQVGILTGQGIGPRKIQDTGISPSTALNLARVLCSVK